MDLLKILDSHYLLYEKNNDIVEQINRLEKITLRRNRYDKSNFRYVFGGELIKHANIIRLDHLKSDVRFITIDIEVIKEGLEHDYDMIFYISFSDCIKFWIYNKKEVVLDYHFNGKNTIRHIIVFSEHLDKLTLV